MRTDPVKTFWERFSAATGITADYDAWAFGDEDSPDLADELAWLVLHGPKRATTCLYEDAVADGDMPTPGAYSVVLDGSGGPVCVIRTTEVDIRPFGEVDDAYAWDEGEGDRSLAFWRQAHIDFFAQNGHSDRGRHAGGAGAVRPAVAPPRGGGMAPVPAGRRPGVAIARRVRRRPVGRRRRRPGGGARPQAASRCEPGRSSVTTAPSRSPRTTGGSSPPSAVPTSTCGALEDLAFEYPADRAGLAVAQWTVRSEDGTALRTVDTTYVVTMDEDRWRIMGEIEHD